MATLIGEAIHRFNVEKDLRLSESRLVKSQRLAHLGNWEWDAIKDEIWWSDEVYRIFGFEQKHQKRTYETFLSYVHPDDRKTVNEAVVYAVNEEVPYSIDHRIIRPDGTERVVHEQAEMIYGQKGELVKMTGAVLDITERVKAENEIRENQKELRALAAQLQIVEEQERRRIAQDLHDSIGQILSFSGRRV